VLVHGGGAHSGWWHHIAPFFADSHHVVALDLSGHGSSGRRAGYSLQTWAQEVVAAGAAANPAAHPTIIGHSMGGWVAATAASSYRSAIEGIVVVDTPLQEHAPEGGRLQYKGKRPAGYTTFDEIADRFRVIPPQATVLPFVSDRIAGESVCQRDVRWFWKFDPAVFAISESDFGSTESDSLERLMEALGCRAAFVRCEHGVVPPAMADRIKSIMQLRGPFVELPDAGHHPMLDQPLALVAVLLTHTPRGVVDNLSRWTW
jgi:pimeloyl-ACP methyl ester carboxylesterase